MPRATKTTAKAAAGGEPEVLWCKTAKEWERWLDRNHESVTQGVWLRLSNKDAPEPSVTYSDAVDVALCFGWIDGQMRKHDATSRVQRFTPRRARSSWSKLNTERALRLITAGRMRPAGQREVDAAQADGRWQRAYEPPSTAVAPPDFMAALERSKKAAAFFATLNKRNTYPVSHRLQNAKTPEARERLIKKFIEMFERGEKFYD